MCAETKKKNPRKPIGTSKWRIDYTGKAKKQATAFAFMVKTDLKHWRKKTTTNATLANGQCMDLKKSIDCWAISLVKDEFDNGNWIVKLFAFF